MVDYKAGSVVSQSSADDENDGEATITLNEIPDFLNAIGANSLIISGITSSIEAGQDVIISFNGKNYTTYVKEDGTFEFEIPTADIESIPRGSYYSNCKIRR